jgi:hypothetical protein
LDPDTFGMELIIPFPFPINYSADFLALSSIPSLNSEMPRLIFSHWVFLSLRRTSFSAFIWAP